jgi:hypothetical protein
LMASINLILHFALNWMPWDGAIINGFHGTFSAEWLSIESLNWTIFNWTLTHKILRFNSSILLRTQGNTWPYIWLFFKWISLWLLLIIWNRLLLLLRTNWDIFFCNWSIWLTSYIFSDRRINCCWHLLNIFLY